MPSHHMPRGRIIRTFMLVLAALLLFTGASRTEARLDDASPQSGIFQAGGTGTPAHPIPQSVLRSRYVTVDLSQLTPSRAHSTSRLTLNPFPDVILTAERDSVEISPDGRVTWLGRIPGLPYSQVTLTVAGGVIV